MLLEYKNVYKKKNPKDLELTFLQVSDVPELQKTLGFERFT